MPKESHHQAGTGTLEAELPPKKMKAEGVQAGGTVLGNWRASFSQLHRELEENEERLEADISELREELKERDEKIEIHSQTIQDLESSLNEEKRKYALSQKESQDDIDGKIATLDQQLKERDATIGTYSRTIQDLRFSLGEEKRKHTSAQRKYLDEKVKSNRLSTECERQAMIEEQSKALRAENENLRQEIKDREAEVDKFNKLAQRATVERDEITSQKQQLESRISSIEVKDLGAQNLTIEAKEKEIVQKNAELQTQSAKLENSTRKLRKQTSKMTDMEIKIGKFSQIHDDLEKSHELKVKEKEKELDKVRIVCRNLEDKIKALEDDLEQSQNELEQSQKELEQIKEEVRKRQLRGITDRSIQAQILELQTSIKDHEDRERETKKELDNLKVHLSKQETNVKEAQEEAFNLAKKREQLQYDFIADSTARAKLHRVLEHCPGEWAEDYAASAFQGWSMKYTSVTSLALWKKLIGKGRDPELILMRYNPRIVLTALLVDFLVEKVLSQPFLRLQVANKESTSSVFAAEISSLYNDFLKVDETGACSWRSQMLEMLSKRDKRSGQDQSILQSTGGEEQFQFPLCDILAKDFVEGPAKILIDPLKDAEVRMKELADQIKQAAWVSALLWKQRVNLHFVYYDGLKNLRYSDDLKDITLREQVSPKVIPRAGASLDMIIRPKITASFAEDDESGNDEPEDEKSEDDESEDDESEDEESADEESEDKKSKNDKKVIKSVNKVWGDPLVVWRNSGDQGGKAVNDVDNTDNPRNGKFVYPDSD